MSHAGCMCRCVYRLCDWSLPDGRGASSDENALLRGFHHINLPGFEHERDLCGEDRGLLRHKYFDTGIDAAITRFHVQHARDRKKVRPVIGDGLGECSAPKMSGAVLRFFRFSASPCGDDQAIGQNNNGYS